MSSRIYDKNIWPRILDKYPDIRELATELGIENDPEKAQQIRLNAMRNFGLDSLSSKERKLATHLSSAEFIEANFLKMVVTKGTFATKAGAIEDANASFELVLSDFNWTFKDFINTCEKKGEDIEKISFARAYEIFLDVIVLKMEYKIPYTKLFIRQLLKMSRTPKEDSIEIKKYFLEHDSTMLENVSQELLADNHN